MNMLFLIVSLLLCTGSIQISVAFELKDSVTDGIASETLKSHPTLKHLIKVSSLDSDLAVKRTTEEKGTETEDPNLAYKFPKDSNEENATIAKLESAEGKYSGEDIDVNKSMTDSPKEIYSKLKRILRKRMQLLLSNRLTENSDTSGLPNSDFPVESSKLIDASSDVKSDESQKHSGDEVLNTETEEASVHVNGNTVRARQFVFHPYLPYGKDVAPDEKISFHDVLPVKMVKFIKGMVEDAPWEKMFMQMVRMVVDQFVDKIIEKMFSHKEEEDDKWRSLDDSMMSPTWKLSKNVVTSVVRLRRSANGKPKSENKLDWTDNSFTSANRVSKEDSAKPKDASPEDESWLDSILDYLFPEDPKAAALENSEDLDRRRKRDANPPTENGNHGMSEIIHSFLLRYLAFQTGRLTPESVDAIVKESFRQKVMKTMFPSDIQMQERLSQVDEESTSDVGSGFSANKLPEILSERWFNVLKKDSQAVIENSSDASMRTKRSTTDDTDKEKDAQRLWQANRRARPSNSKTRDDCSLRRACNAGRLLSRLPSVQDITLQLKGYGNEPHWDALLWGMTKKRCSRIFCKRQRAPKGSKRHWDAPEKRNHRKSTPTSRAPRLRYEESDLTTIYPV